MRVKTKTTLAIVANINASIGARVSYWKGSLRYFIMANEHWLDRVCPNLFTPPRLGSIARTVCTYDAPGGQICPGVLTPVESQNKTFIFRPSRHVKQAAPTHLSTCGRTKAE